MNSRKAVQPINTTEGYLIPSQHETLARGLSIFRPANRTFIVLVATAAAAAAAAAAAWPCSSDIPSPISLPPRRPRRPPIRAERSVPCLGCRERRRQPRCLGSRRRLDRGLANVGAPERRGSHEGQLLGQSGRSSGSVRRGDGACTDASKYKYIPVYVTRMPTP